MGTFVEIGFFRSEIHPFVMTRAFEKMEKVQELMSFHSPDSELSLLNRSCREEIRLHPLTALVLKLAKRLTHLSGGLFDCGVGGQLVAEQILPRHRTEPTSDIEPNNLMGTIKDLEIKGVKAFCRKPLCLTLDGIAKGLAVDLAVKELRSSGVASGWVCAGGDLRVFGDLSLPVQRRSRDFYFSALGELRNAAMATSWVREVFDPRFPGKIVSPHKSRKPKPGAWSVVASSTWLADGLTKVACLAPSHKRSQIIKKLGGYLLRQKGKK